MKQVCLIKVFRCTEQEDKIPMVTKEFSILKLPKGKKYIYKSYSNFFFFFNFNTKVESPIPLFLLTFSQNKLQFSGRLTGFPVTLQFL